MNTRAMASAMAQSAPEHEVKSIYLYNFARYVEWPPGRTNSPSTGIVIGVYRRDPFGAVLDETVQGKTAHDLPFSIRRIKPPGEALECHIVFVSGLPEGQVREALQLLDQHAVLTVGEDDAFARAGGMIAFVREGDRIRFDIALGTVEAAGLRIRAPLIKLARKVTTGKGDAGRSVNGTRLK